MKLAITGCNGSVGRAVVEHALEQGFQVVGIDITEAATDANASSSNSFCYIQADLRDYEANLKAFEGCNAIIALAAHPNPGDYVWQSHNTNVVISWNTLRSAAQLGINRIAQASSVNVVALVYSQEHNFRYFPIDEDHPLEPDEPYGLSKIVAELQADTIVRRNPDMRVASLRLHWAIPNREYAYRLDPAKRRLDLWGWVQKDSAAKCFLLAVTDKGEGWAGHEAFFVSAPDTTQPCDTRELHGLFWSNVPIKEGKNLDGRTSFFDSSKAERLIGWKHEDSPDSSIDM